MNAKISEHQLSAKKFQELLERRAKAQAGDIQIVYVNDAGQPATGYINILKVVVDLEVDGQKRTVSIGDLLGSLYDDMEKKERRIKELETACLNAVSHADKAISIVKNMEKYMPSGYTGV